MCGFISFSFCQNLQVFDLAAANVNRLSKELWRMKERKEMSFVTRLVFSAVTSYNHHNPVLVFKSRKVKATNRWIGKGQEIGAREEVSKSTNIWRRRAVGETCSGFASPASTWIRAGCKSPLRTLCRLLCLRWEILKILRRSIKLNVTSELGNSCGQLPSQRMPHSPPRLPLRHHSFELIWKTP